jgi:hypothetical protein
MRYGQKVIVVLSLLSATSFAWPAMVRAEEITLKSNETAEINTIFWISQCKSVLKSIAGVDILESPPGITLTIKEEVVNVRRQNCEAKVPGGKVIATVRDINAPVSGTLRYRVRYKTLDGDRQSTHSVNIFLYP